MLHQIYQPTGSKQISPNRANSVIRTTKTLITNSNVVAHRKQRSVSRRGADDLVKSPTTAAQELFQPFDLNSRHSGFSSGEVRRSSLPHQL